MMLYLFASVVAVFATSDDYSYEYEKIQRLQDKVMDLKEKIMGDSQRSRKVMAGLYQLKKNMKKISKECTEYEDEIFALRGSIGKISEVIQKLDEQTGQRRSQLRQRVVSLYKLGGRGFMATLFGSESSSELDRNLRVLHQVISNDFQLLSTYRDNIDLLEYKRKVMGSRLKSLDEKRSKVASLKAKLEKKAKLNMRIINSLKRSRAKQLAQLKIYKEHLRTTIEKTEEIEFLNSLMNPTLLEKKGRLPLPVRGPITEPYGLKSLRGNNVKMRNKGIFIRTADREAVEAVFPGEVVYAGSYPTNTNTVILSHGSNYYTVYSNMVHLTVKEGEFVEGGKKVGETAHDVFGNQSGLHFEIRYFSDPVNPTEWLDMQESVNVSSAKVNL